ncbi:MAG: DUF2520 domain-containing protein [Bacteroidales bacterium]|nr:DUF2520 domain-containing protein [Bacteroidales bacterium]
MAELNKIVILGAGNVATHLSKAFAGSGFQILQIYNRSIEPAKKLAKTTGSDFTDKIENITDEADLYVIATSDNAIEEIAMNLNKFQSMVVHTSGSVSMDILKPASPRTGVFYPLQTFSKKRKVNYKTVPLCLEASTESDLMLLKKLADSISQNVYAVDSGKRMVLHMAAVFACNFTNFLYDIAGTMVHEVGLDFDILRPLIRETAEKVMKMEPSEAQTGPAKRNDEIIMHQHISLLEENEILSLLYEFMSNEISKLHHGSV